MRHIKYTVAICSFVVLTACSQTRLEQQNPLDMAEGISWQEKVAGPATSNLKWQDIQDQTVAGLVDQALSDNLSVKNAILSIQSSRLALAGVRDANDGLDYSSTAAASLDESKRVDLLTGFSLSGTASYEIDLWGDLGQAIDSAELTVQQSMLALDTVKISLVAEITDSYYTIRTLDARLDLRRATLKNAYTQLKFIEARRQSGIVSGIDIDQQQVRIKALEIAIEELEATRKSEVLRLSRLTGQVPQALQVKALDRLQLPLVRLAAGTPVDVLRNRPDIKEQEIAMANQYLQFEIARKAFFPSLTIAADTSVSNSDLGDFLTGKVFSWGIGVDLIQTLLDTGARKRAVEAEKIAAERQMNTYKDTILRAMEEVEGALINQESSARQITSLDLQLKNQRRVVREFEARYKQGFVSLQDLITQQNSQLNLEEDLLTTRLNGLRSTITLMRVTGVKPELGVKPE